MPALIFGTFIFAQVSLRQPNLCFVSSSVPQPVKTSSLHVHRRLSWISIPLPANTPSPLQSLQTWLGYKHSNFVLENAVMYVSILLIFTVVSFLSFTRPPHQSGWTRKAWTTTPTVTPGGSQKNSWSITPISSGACSPIWTPSSWVGGS